MLIIFRSLLPSVFLVAPNPTWKPLNELPLGKSSTSVSPYSPHGISDAEYLFNSPVRSRS
jgi:hypothetical protein